MRIPMAAVLAMGLVLSACANQGAAIRQARVVHYLGMSETDLLRERGAPTRTIESAGHRFLAYDRKLEEYVPPARLASASMFGFARGFGYVYPARVITWACETTFEIVDGKVIAMTERGNYC